MSEAPKFQYDRDYARQFPIYIPIKFYCMVQKKRRYTFSAQQREKLDLQEVTSRGFSGFPKYFYCKLHNCGSGSLFITLKATKTWFLFFIFQTPSKQHLQNCLTRNESWALIQQYLSKSRDKFFLNHLRGKSRRKSHCLIVRFPWLYLVACWRKEMCPKT